MRNVVHLVDEFSPVNFGIWHAAVAASQALLDRFAIKSFLVAPANGQEFPKEKFPAVTYLAINNTSSKGAKEFFQNWKNDETVVVSHGVWQYPTRWGHAAAKMGFAWIYTPHGMLEPWSMAQKKFKKSIYYGLIEGPLSRKAHLVRAVGAPESQHLKKMYKNVVHIPNGVYASDFLEKKENSEKVAVLFLARLHFKKGIIPLVKAWMQAQVSKSSSYELLIAGTDDGEKKNLEDLLAQNPGANIRFLGPMFGEQKADLLRSCTFYILPSQSEGFPTSVVEAMAAGLIPIISPGCNFPEAFENQMAIKTGTSEHEIVQSLNEITQLSPEKRQIWAARIQEFARRHYLWDQIGLQLNEIYLEALKNRKN